MDRFDLVVIGSGPGGYVAAIKASKLGMKTAIIEAREIGGTCLNRGCIPTKTLMHSSHLYQEAKSFQEAGIHFEGLSFHMEELQKRKEEVVQKIRQGIVGLLEANKIDIYYGRATIIDNSHVKVQGPEADSEVTLESGKILIATGSSPVVPKLEGISLPKVVTSDELLMKEEVFKKLLIIGGGVIGVEFASIYCDLGCEVEIVEAMDRILPNMDKEISQSIAMSLKKKGVVIHTKARVVRLLQGEQEELVCEYEEKDSIKSTNADGVLLSVGRRANFEGLFAPDLIIEREGNCIKVNAEFETTLEGIYAIGDVIVGKQLAHAASAQGIAAVEGMLKLPISIDLSVIPSCLYTTPEAAEVGLTEEEAKERGYRIKTGKYPMLGNCKTVLSRGERGFIKVVSEADTGRILGAQLLCERATDLVSEFSTAISKGMTTSEVASIIRPHPTYSEAITEAVEDVEGMAIHLLPKKR